MSRCKNMYNSYPCHTKVHRHLSLFEIQNVVKKIFMHSKNTEHFWGYESSHYYEYSRKVYLLDLQSTSDTLTYKINIILIGLFSSFVPALCPNYNQIKYMSSCIAFLTPFIIRLTNRFNATIFTTRRDVVVV